MFECYVGQHGLIAEEKQEQSCQFDRNPTITKVLKKCREEKNPCPAPGEGKVKHGIAKTIKTKGF